MMIKLPLVLVFFTSIASYTPGILSAVDVSHECIRECSDGPKNCIYDFKIEWYYTMSRACYNCPRNESDCFRPHCVATDGVGRGIVVANRQLTGPAIHVCENDTVIVNVINLLPSESTSIHWQRIHQRNGYAYMDGVPMLTQCPIHPHTQFQYKFVASPSGTHLWHSHSGTQRMDGLMGPLVVRQSPSRELHRARYDYDLPEHVIMMNDWVHDVSMERFTAYHHQRGNNKPSSILINGKGEHGTFADTGTNTIIKTPQEIYKVKQGKRYRFRVISSGNLLCPFLLSIDHHNMTIIATDGQPTLPYEVESLVVYAGERFDFVLMANNEVRRFWVKVKGLGDCVVNSVKQTAVVHYEGSTDEDPTEGRGYNDMDRAGIRLNPLNTYPSKDRIPIVELNSAESDDPTSKAKADIQFFVGFDIRQTKNPHFYDEDLYALSSFKEHIMFTPQFNNISMGMPSSPLLYQMSDVSEDLFCNSNNTRRCGDTYCECIHVLRAGLNQVVELVLVDEAALFSASHPIHLHGHSFRVVAQDKVGDWVTTERVKEMDRVGNITRKLSGAVLKDTVVVPAGGYTIIRFYTDNPGVWIMHCHLEFHLELGMALVVQVGEPREFPAVPEDFPRCGHFKPASQSTVTKGTTPPSGGRSRDQTTALLVLAVVCCMSYLY